MTEIFSIRPPLAAANWSIFAASIFLVSVPVFMQAPLVRFLPWLSLSLSLLLWWVGWQLSQRTETQRWGDLLIGFTWTWLAGSIYWGWFRWEPSFHLPIESIGLPFAVWGITQHRNRIGNFFFLGSLFGTAVTDLYFYLADLIPYWRNLMQVEQIQAEQVQLVFHQAIAQMLTPWGVCWAIMLALALIFVGFASLCSRQDCWWAFGGAVLSTILVDGLFWLTAALS